MKIQTPTLACAAALALAACAGSTQTTAASTTGTGASEITTFQWLAAQTQTAAGNYRTTAMSAAFDAASCVAVHDGYDAQVRPWITQMMQMSGDMDDFMDTHGGAGAADLACTSSAMMAELEHHRAVACTFADDASDRNEAVRHANVMMMYGGSAYGRCDEMNGVLDGGSHTWAPMMDGCEGRDDGQHRADGG